MPKRSILLVEDNPDDEILMLDALQRSGLGAQVEIARDGAEALEKLSSQPDFGAQCPLPGLVLMDLKLPKLNGIEVLRRLRTQEHTRYLPVVMLTSSSEIEDIRESYRSGANAYVRKPIEFERFVEAVRCLERFWLCLNETPAA